jgi:hypothetical protein
MAQSDMGDDQKNPRDSPNQPRSSGCLAGLFALIGVIMLLPGICSIFFMQLGFGSSIGLLISVVGVFLIVGALMMVATPRSKS